MEQEDIKTAIIERFNSLQPEIQNIIINTNYEENLYEISKKHNLTDEQYKELELNTTLVLLGNTHPDEYKSEIIEDLIISDTEAISLISDINEKILNSVLPIIKQNFIDDDTEQELLENTSNDAVPLPPYATSNKQEVVSSKSEVNNATDIYREHGIDIISNEYPQTTKMDVLKNQEAPKEEKSTDNSNIIANKLFNNTASQKVVTDYSIPKVNPLLNNNTSPQGSAPTKPHDPYHEPI